MARFSPVVPAVGTGNPNVRLQATAWGDKFTGHVRANAPGDAIQPAGLFSTAPYGSAPTVVPIYVDPLPEPDDPDEPYEPDDPDEPYDPEDGGPITEETPIVVITEEPPRTGPRRRTHHIAMPTD